MGTILSNRQPSAGWRIKISAYVGTTVPTEETITLGAAVTKADTTLDLTGNPLGQDIAAGNYLLFTDSNGVTFPVKVTADAASGATSLTIAAADGALATAATATFPPELLDRSEVSVDETFNTSTTQSLNTGGAEVVVPTTKSVSISAPGFWFQKNAGYLTLKDKAAVSESVGLIIEYPNQDTSLYQKGEVWTGQGIITSLTTSGAADGEITNDLNLAISGTLTKTDPLVT